MPSSRFHRAWIRSLLFLSYSVCAVVAQVDSKDVGQFVERVEAIQDHLTEFESTGNDALAAHLRQSLDATLNEIENQLSPDRRSFRRRSRRRHTALSSRLDALSAPRVRIVRFRLRASDPDSHRPGAGGEEPARKRARSARSTLAATGARCRGRRSDARRRDRETRQTYGH